MITGRDRPRVGTKSPKQPTRTQLLIRGATPIASISTGLKMSITTKRAVTRVEKYILDRPTQSKTKSK